MIMKKDRDLIKVFMFFIVLSAFLLKAVFGYAEDVNFDLTVDRTKTALGGSIQLSLTFHDTQNVPELQLPKMDGFEVRYLGPATKFSIINGKTTSEITHNYILVPVKTGTFIVGPLTLNYKGKTYKSNSISVEAVEGSVQGGHHVQEDSQSQAELKDRIFLVMQADKQAVYLNEILPVIIKLYVNRLSVRDVQYPEFLHEGFSGGEFTQPAQYQENIAGVVYDVIEFKTNLFGIKEGAFTLGPANLKCNLMVKKERKQVSGFDNFFGDDFFDNFLGGFQAYPMELNSAQIPVTVLSLPEEDKPENSAAAVGNFTFAMEAESREVKVGDPITVKMIIKGSGNYNTVACPKFDSQEGFKVYEPQVVQQDSAKMFEQIIMPKSEDVKEIPKAVFVFFDTNTKEYKTLSNGPIPIKVIKPQGTEGLKIVEGLEEVRKPFAKETLGKDIIYIKESPGKLVRKNRCLYKNKGFLSLQMLPFFLFIIIAVFHKRHEKLKTDLRYARRLNAPKKAKKGLKEAGFFLEEGNVPEFFGAVFRTLQEYLGNKFHVSSAGITWNFADDVLKPKGVKEEVLRKLKEIFKNCDMARFAPAEFNQEQMEQTFKDLEDVVDYLEKQKI